MVMAFGPLHAVVGLITQVWGTWQFKPTNISAAEQILEWRSSGTACMMEVGRGSTQKIDYVCYVMC